MNVRFTLTILAAFLFLPTASRADEALFGRQVVPTLYKLGCSAGTCHGAFAGKGNFRLSLFAADPAADYREIRGAFGRRLNLNSPDDSLLLLKPTGRLPHGGDVRIKIGSPEYHLLKGWIESGARYDAAAEGHVLSVRVEPTTPLCKIGSDPVPLRVLARMSNGNEQDVTRFSRFEPFDTTIAEADADGRVTGLRPGDTHILAHYAGQIGYAIALVPGERPADLQFPNESLADAVDRMIVDKLKKLNIVPARQCSDGEFLRRVYLDVTGQLPATEEVRKFLADPTPDKRARKIDELLVHPLHAAVWANKLCDITGADNRIMYDKAVCDFYDWYRNKLEANMPWDELVQRVFSATTANGLTAEQLAAEAKRAQEAAAAAAKKKADAKKKGGQEGEQAGDDSGDDAPVSDKPWRSGYATRNTLDVFFFNNKFRVQAGPDKGKIDPQIIALHAANAFLGVRLECAECHKHPHDRWTQNDFRGFTSAFSYINRGRDPDLMKKGIVIAGVLVSDTPLQTFTDSVTGEPLGPRVLGGAPIEMKPGVDPRLEVWKWMASPENPYFAKAMVNRVWAHYFGRGLIDPVDALAAGNPPSHPDVMEELVRDFIAHKYDLRHLHRRILNTRAYQRGWETNVTNASDERNLSHRVLRRMSAEQALDAVAQITGTGVELAWVYGGGGKGGAKERKIERAIECPLSRPGGAGSYLLKIFDKPQRTQSCDCERGETPTVSQSLYFYNDAALVAKIAARNGRLTKLLTEVADDGKVLEELYLAVLTRLPSPAERERSLQHVKAAGSRAEGFQDLLWSLFNRQEFVVNH